MSHVKERPHYISEVPKIKTVNLYHLYDYAYDGIEPDVESTHWKLWANAYRVAAHNGFDFKLSSERNISTILEEFYTLFILVH